ncbi:DUF4298 domain-containing protein [Butyrivibrio sp. WCE2006]|uniref:DUF4298 domain-containing protein n=1 Tax=Butyrivibrio sp. WCE2006 TaxID=1410611 RepID=UPI0009DDBE9E|nr:DUF4298 domain-containing protein [Butyrivibrio sp. WCE2006]
MDKITEAIQRVTGMEGIYDRALKIMDNVENDQEEFLNYQAELMKLADYYSSPDWKDDFALDEEGKLPQDLKRGVLSEDGVYNLLERNKELLDQRRKSGSNIGMKYLKLLNLIPLIMFFIIDKLRGTLISRYLLIIIVALGVVNMFLAKGMKDYLISSLMLVASTVVGMIIYTYFYYYFVSANPDAPIVGAAIMMVYGFIAFAVAAVGTVVVVIKDRKNKER